VEQIWTIATLLSWTADYFAKKSISSARLDAELLLADLLGHDRIYLYVNFDRPLLADELAGYKERVKRRAANEPLAYILGRREFYKLDFTVTPAVLIPRPETEILVASAIEQAKVADSKRALDLGTGSGAIAVSLLVNLPELIMKASDLSTAALEIARANAEKHSVAVRTEFVVSDWFTNIASERFDIIVSNPPYIELSSLGKLQPELGYEPQSALYADADGLCCYRTILARAYEYLAVNGKLFLEVGFNQAEAVAKIAKSANKYGSVEFVKDYSGIDRVVVISANGPS
jgi:release factor glutamine methyltransferase